MASANFCQVTVALASAGIDFTADDFKVLLVASVPADADITDWIKRSDVDSEITGTNYTAGGILQSLTVGVVDTVAKNLPITLQDIVSGWSGATFSTVGAIVYKDTGVAATDTLCFYVDFGGTQSVTAGDFSITYTAPFYINA